MRAVLAFVAVALATTPAFAQHSTIPRTAEGRPDFHSYWFTGFITPMERPDGITDLTVAPDNAASPIAKLIEDRDEGEVCDPEFDSNTIAPALLELNGELRSSRIVEPADGQLPLTALAKAALTGGGSSLDNPENRPPPERCMQGVVNAPLTSSFLMIPLQLVQTRDPFVLMMEDLEPARIVTLSAPARPDALRTRGGESRGKWEATRWCRDRPGRHLRQAGANLERRRFPHLRQQGDRTLHPHWPRRAALPVHRRRPLGLHKPLAR